MIRKEINTFSSGIGNLKQAEMGLSFSEMVLHSLSGLFPPGTATNQYSFSDAMTPTHLTLVGGGGYWTEHTPMGVVSREGAAMDELEQVSFSLFSFSLVYSCTGGD